jgi:hypothetical protein
MKMTKNPLLATVDIPDAAKIAEEHKRARPAAKEVDLNEEYNREVERIFKEVIPRFRATDGSTQFKFSTWPNTSLSQRIGLRQRVAKMLANKGFNILCCFGEDNWLPVAPHVFDWSWLGYATYDHLEVIYIELPEVITLE